MIENLQNQRGARLITLIHRQETISLLGIPVSKSINIDDAEAFLRAIRLTPPDKPIGMILHTRGGLVLAASQIANKNGYSGDSIQFDGPISPGRHWSAFGQLCPNQEARLMKHKPDVIS
jgi:hypothetical protein